MRSRTKNSSGERVESAKIGQSEKSLALQTRARKNKRSMKETVKWFAFPVAP